MKKVLLIGMVLLLTLTGCGKEETKVNEDQNIISQNTNDNVIKRQEIDGIVFDNVILKINGNMSSFTVDVTNNNKEKENIKYIKVTAYDNQNKKLFEFNSYIGDNIDTNQTLKLSSNVEGDLTSVYSVKYEIIK